MSFQTTDEFEQHKMYFTMKAREALLNKAYSMIIQRNEETLDGHTRVFDQVSCWGVVVEKTRKPEAIDLLIDVINKVAETYPITGTLCPLGSFDIAPCLEKGEQVLVFAYFAIDYKFEDSVRSTLEFDGIIFKEGHLPNHIDELYWYHSMKFDTAFEQEISK